MLRTLMLCASILVLLNGCATYRNDNLERMQALPQKYSQFDAKLAWEVKSAGNSTIIDGVVQNIRYYMMNELEIWVWSLDDRGKEIHRSVDFVYSLKENETAQFTVELPKVASGTKLRFMYRYIGNDGGGDSGGALSWMQSFESEMP
ncbi:MAG: hypothetical protein H7X83_09980 [Verrucomicrobia bacterium]|nr:hypothetical protein [Deltaproteobacteria bacterium]